MSPSSQAQPSSVASNRKLQVVNTTLGDTPAAAGGGSSIVGHLLDGRYRVDAPIAAGGMATVYRALDTRLDRVLAVKVMHPSLAGDAGFVQRFIREAKSVARLDHPNLVNVYDQGADGGYVFLAMEYVPGCTLRDVLRERRALPPRAALDILEPVLAALGAAHLAGLVHRDMKPENVLIGNDGRVKVADFGLVRAVGTDTTMAAPGSVLGTVSYLAPEQIESGTSDTRSDVYACGVMLYEMLTGTKPHAGDNPAQVLYQRLNREITPPSQLVPGLSGELDALVARATARQPDQRPSTAVELLALLQAVRRSLTDAELDIQPLGAKETASAGDGITAVIPRPAGAGEANLDRTRTLPLSPARQGAAQSWWPPGRRLVVLLTVAVLALVAGAAIWYAGFGRYNRVPQVYGMSQIAADNELESAGLAAKFTTAYSEKVPTGKVISTDPGAGHRIRGNGPVTVVISKGPHRIAVPNVAGKPREVAEQAIQDAGLAVGKRSREFSDDVAKDSVIRTDPAAGSELKPKTAVSMVLSRGRALDVPDVVGSSVDEAQADLAELGLTVRIAPARVFSDDVDSGSVAKQSPGAGSQAASGDTVTLTISKGPRLFEVPDVEGMKIGEARKALEDAGFVVREFNLPLGSDKVWQQSPGGGSQKRKGSTITLYVN